MIAVPCASPSGMSPGGLFVNSSSSSFWDIVRSWGTSYAMSVASSLPEPALPSEPAAARMSSAAFSATM